MLDLEQAIAQWREQMLAAGIKAPVPLDELESHLREEVDSQIELGLEPQKALAVAIEKIGQIEVLKPELAKVGGVKMTGGFSVRNGWIGLFCLLVYFAHGLFMYPMNISWRLGGIATIALWILFLAPNQYIGSLFPVVSNRRIRKLMLACLIFGGVISCVVLSSIYGILAHYDGPIWVEFHWLIIFLLLVETIGTRREHAAKRAGLPKQT